MKHKSEYTKNLISDGHLFMSVESTDLDGRIIKIQIVDSYGKVLLDTFVHPRWRIKKSVAECKHKITNEMTKDAPRWKSLITTIAGLTSGKKVFAYNAEYVENVLLQTSRAHKVSSIDINLFCLMRMVSQHVGSWNDYFEDYQYVKLVDACIILNVQYDENNKALTLQKIFHALTLV